MNDHEKLFSTLFQECTQLRAENALLRKCLNLYETQSQALKTSTTEKKPPQNQTPNEFSPQEKIEIFHQLFRGREDVYAVRWEGKNGKSGYSPACIHDWNCPLCKGNRSKRSQCKNRKFHSLTPQAIQDHLTGKQVLGVYPLLLDETCSFLAVDFDKSNWQEDTKAFLQSCQDWFVPAALERSRSGNGAHVWIFFEKAISASLACQLGSILLTHAME